MSSSRLRRAVVLLLGCLLVAVGALWTFQGLGYIKGSSMTDVESWAIVGPIVAGLGVALAMVALRRSG